MTDWDAIVAVNYADAEDQIVADSEPIQGELKGLVAKWRREADESAFFGRSFAERADELEAVISSRSQEDLAYGGVCPVCGDEFTDGWTRLKDLEHESIEGVRVCVINPPDDCLFHLPEDQNPHPEAGGGS